MKICITTLGCKTNQYESEKMAENLNNFGFEVVHGLEFADVFILNSCSVTAEADKKSRQTIAKFNKLNPKCDIIVCGCSSQFNQKQFNDKKNVKLVLGVKNKFELVDYIYKNYNFLSKQTMIKSTRTRKYLKIQDGCNNFCSYCIIPFLRGREISRNVNEIVEEAKQIEEFCKEIVLTGINISAYGRDLGISLTNLILALCDVNARIRIGSLEINVISENFLLACKGLKNFCPHFHLSMQSGCNKVLKAMNRHYTSETFINKVKLIRKHFPNAFIGCDVIVGFPGENDSDFVETVKTINKIKFSFMHIFPYSNREGTLASKMQQVDSKIVYKRESILQKLNIKYSYNFIKSCIGKKAYVLIEKFENDLFVGYSENYVKCYLSGNCKIGEIKQCVIEKVFKDGVFAKN